MNATLFNAVYAPLSVAFGCHITAQMPRELALKIAHDMEHGPQDGLAVALEFCVQRRYFVQLLEQQQVIDEFDCTEEQYNNKLVPSAAVQSASQYDNLRRDAELPQ